MTHELVLHGARLISGEPDTVPDVDTSTRPDAWVAVAGGRVAGIGHGEPPPADDVVDVAGDWLAPGFVDVHVHGGAGGDVMSPDRDARDAVRRFHVRHGTTALLASTVSRHPDDLDACVRRLADDAHDPDHDQDDTMARLVGIHLEGPFLAAARRGAHDETALRDPDPAEVERLLETGRGQIRRITVAPELPGGLDLVRRLVAAGVNVSLGHTDADAATMSAAVEAGARSVTHTFNGMRPLHHRRPGAVGVAMDAAELTCELILDLVHVDPIAARALVHCAPGRVCLVTDSMAAAGMTDGRYELGGLDVDVQEGRAQVIGTTTLAGSTLTMATAVENAVAHLGLDVPRAVAMATTVPAGLLPGIDVGRLHEGGPADLVRLDDVGRLRDVWVSGTHVAQPARGDARDSGRDNGRPTGREEVSSVR